METKTEWYKKLAKKLDRIKIGELSLDDYIKEVNDKIENGNEALGLGAVIDSASPKKVKYCADGKRVCDCMGLVCSR